MLLIYIYAGLTITALVGGYVHLRLVRRANLKTDDEIATAARDGKWTLAISSYALQHNVGREEARERVEALTSLRQPKEPSLKFLLARVTEASKRAAITRLVITTIFWLPITLAGVVYIGIALLPLLVPPLYLTWVWLHDAFALMRSLRRREDRYRERPWYRVMLVIGMLVFLTWAVQILPKQQQQPTTTTTSAALSPSALRDEL